MTKPCTLWLIRHGETDWNLAGRMQGHLEVPLNETGRRQARLLAQRLGREPHRFAALFSSDLGRAKETAAEIGQVLQLVPSIRPALRERNFGVLAELTMAEAEARQPELFALMRARDTRFVPPGGESLTQLSHRVLEELLQIAWRWPGEQVIVVSHGGAIDIAWRAATGAELSAKRGHDLLNASINRVVFDGAQFALAGWGDVSHLDEGQPSPRPSPPRGEGEI
jgi:2,3-bisphosphoglycerate-dependent phosphoglycerate mutase